MDDKPIALPGEIDEDLRAIITAALDLCYYRTLDKFAGADLASSVAWELEHRAGQLPERTADKMIHDVEQSIKARRRREYQGHTVEDEDGPAER